MPISREASRSAAVVGMMPWEPTPTGMWSNRGLRYLLLPAFHISLRLRQPHRMSSAEHSIGEICGASDALALFAFKRVHASGFPVAGCALGTLWMVGIAWQSSRISSVGGQAAWCVDVAGNSPGWCV